MLICLPLIIQDASQRAQIMAKIQNEVLNSRRENGVRIVKDSVALFKVPVRPGIGVFCLSKLTLSVPLRTNFIVRQNWCDQKHPDEPVTTRYLVSEMRLARFLQDQSNRKALRRLGPGQYIEGEQTISSVHSSVTLTR